MQQIDYILLQSFLYLITSCEDSNYLTQKIVFKDHLVGFPNLTFSFSLIMSNYRKIGASQEGCQTLDHIPQKSK